MKTGERPCVDDEVPDTVLRDPACPLCNESDTGIDGTVAHTECLRVVRATDVAGFPAFYRVVWHEHVREMSDLSPRQRAVCMEVVVAVERVLRQLSPAKINVASLGNVVPHLHWHVVARFDWDSHFPDPIWAAPRRSVGADRLEALASEVARLDERVARAVGAAFPPPLRARTG